MEIFIWGLKTEFTFIEYELNKTVWISSNKFYV